MLTSTLLVTAVGVVLDAGSVATRLHHACHMLYISALPRRARPNNSKTTRSVFRDALACMISNTICSASRSGERSPGGCRLQSPCLVCSVSAGGGRYPCSLRLS